MRLARRISSARFLLSLLTSSVLLTCKEPSGPVLAAYVQVHGPATLYVGESTQFTAVAIATSGDTLSSRPIVWSSGDTSIATVTPLGFVTTHGVGDLGINASVDGKVGSALLSVQPAPVFRVDVFPGSVDSLFVGDSLQFTAIPRDGTGGVLTGRSITWATSDTTKATVSAAGFVRTRGAGSFTVTATSGGRTGGVFLYAQLRVASLAMPESLTLMLSRRVRLIADLRSASGTHLSGPLVTWSSSDPTVLEIDEDGVVTAHRIGTAAVMARSLGFADSTMITTIPDSIARLEFAYRYFYVPGDTTVDAIEALAYDRFGVRALGNSFAWTSSDTIVARVRGNPTDNSIAQITGLEPGRSMITATASGVSLTGSVYVRFGPSRIVIQPDTIAMPVGRIVLIAGVGLDRFGNRVDISSIQQSLTVEDTTIAVMDPLHQPNYANGRRPGITNVVLHAANGMTDTAVIVVQDSAKPSLQWERASLNPRAYTTGPVVLQAFDNGRTPATVPRDVHLVSSDTAIAVLTQATLSGMTAIETVTVRFRKSGAASLIATSDSMYASIFVAVDDVSPYLIQIGALPAVIRVGDTLRLGAVVRGAYGDVHDVPLTWTTSDANRATISDSGLVTAVAAGEVTFVAAIGSSRATVAGTIQSVDPPVIDSVEATPLMPGATAVLRGHGFDVNPAANTVLVDGVSTLVSAASDSDITVVLPPRAVWPCTATHNARLVVTSGGRLAVDSAPLTVAIQRAPATGQPLVLSDEEVACNEVAAAGTWARYLVSAVNTGATTPISFELRGASGTLPGGAAAGPEPAEQPAAVSLVGGVVPSLDSLRRMANVHRRILEQNRAVAARAGAPAPLLRASRRLMPQRSVTATINAIARVRIPRIENPDFCASYRSIDARLVYRGTRVAIFEDVTAPLARTMDGVYQAIAQEFDNVMYWKLRANYGDPLTLDSLLDGDGRIAMVFSPVVNGYGVGGFVVSCDFYPESVAPSSNTGEIFYAQVPTAPGTGFGQYTVDAWRWLTRTIVMHESKHLTAYAERLARGAPLETTWLEEGSAVLAEELWSRDIYGTTWKGSATYGQTIYCDVRPTFPQCAGRPFSMFNAFAFLNDYARSVERHTPLGPSDPNDATFYGSGWALLRWAIDQSGATEQAFLSDLTREPILTGIANLSARAGRPANTLIADWSQALYLSAGGGEAHVTALAFPTWNLASIFAGMRQDFPQDFPQSFSPRWASSGAFLLPVSDLPPGGVSLLGVDNVAVINQLLEFRAPGGGPPPPSLRIQILRLF